MKIETNKIVNGDTLSVLKTFPENSIDCVVTSPPYWQKRDYGVEGQLGLEEDFNNYIHNLVSVFDEVYRVLKAKGTLWVNIGDTYYGGNRNSGNTKPLNKVQQSNSSSSGVKPKWNFKKYKRKSLCMIPSRFAIEMINKGWILRNEIVWHKPNAMPESVKDRFTTDYEEIFFFTKSSSYYFDQLKEPSKWYANGSRAVNGRSLNGEKASAGVYRARGSGLYSKDGLRNKRTVWSISTHGYAGAHFAVFPPEIPEIAIKAGCPENGIVLDPFIGSGTTGVVAEKLGRRWIGIDLNKQYCEMAEKRLRGGGKDRN